MGVSCTQASEVRCSQLSPVSTLMIAVAGLDIALQEEAATAKGELVLPLRGFIPGGGATVRMGEGSDNVGARTQVGREIVRIDLLLDAAGAGGTTANELTIAIKLVAAVGGGVDSGP